MPINKLNVVLKSEYYNHVQFMNSWVKTLRIQRGIQMVTKISSITTQLIIPMVITVQVFATILIFTITFVYSIVFLSIQPIPMFRLCNSTRQPKR